MTIDQIEERVRLLEQARKTLGAISVTARFAEDVTTRHGNELRLLWDIKLDEYSNVTVQKQGTER